MRLVDGKLVAGIAGRCVSERFWWAGFAGEGRELLLTQPGGADDGPLAASVPSEALGSSGEAPGPDCTGKGWAPSAAGSDGRVGRPEGSADASPSPEARATEELSSRVPSGSTCRSSALELPDGIDAAGRSGLPVAGPSVVPTEMLSLELPLYSSDGGAPSAG